MTTTPSSATLREVKKTIAKAIRSPRHLSMTEFDRRFSNRKDGFKYEFVKGQIIKTEKSMKPTQYHIVDNLLQAFLNTKAHSNGDILAVEMEQITGVDQKRIPDLCLFPKEKRRAKDFSISNFAIEINSPTDKNDEIIQKREEYFLAGVQVIWQIDPINKTVSVYTSPRTVKICGENEICSAAPAIPDFEMTVNAIFDEHF